MANIYLNEFDRSIVHNLKPLAYMRYGDDFICFSATKTQAEAIRSKSVGFLQSVLFLKTNPLLDCLKPVTKGVSYLGIEFWPSGHHLNERMRQRINSRLDKANYASYEAMILAHEKPKRHKELQWQFAKLSPRAPKNKKKLKS